MIISFFCIMIVMLKNVCMVMIVISVIRCFGYGRWYGMGLVLIRFIMNR